MTEENAWANKQGSTWQLVFALSVPGRAAADCEALRYIVQAVDELELPPTQRGRIAHSVAGALRKARDRDGRERHNAAVCIRIWIWRPSTAVVGSGLPARTAPWQRDRGWGFFLLEKQGDGAAGAQAESERLIELYLYQEAVGAG